MNDLYLPRPERLRIRFGLKTFFVLLTLCGVWLGVQVKWVRDRHRAMEGVDWSDHPYPYLTPAPWSLRLFGELGVTGISVERDEVLYYQTLFPEAAVVEWVEPVPAQKASLNPKATKPER